MARHVQWRGPERAVHDPLFPTAQEIKMPNDDAILTLLRQVHTENRRRKRAGLVLLALLAVTILPGWIYQDPEPNLVAVQQALKTGRLELTNAQGKVIAVLQAVDSKQSEVVVAYWSDGVKMFEVQTKDGGWHGTFTSWDQSGVKSGQGVYLDGRKHGLWVFYAEKNEDGRQIRAPIQVQRGNFEKGIKIGKWETWYPTGQKESDGGYDAEGNLTGDWQFWKPDGMVDLQKTGKYSEGKRVL